ncbi:type 4b pilus protein PilO2 [Bordetella bronchialis]|uniref:Type 4b pilus protein PilO2 n=1 Tax=Bordetella bronchialis TaxID=463025 RepID=A0A193FVR6_9BORD|nr:type 4b pilus protein PilO2 [Bordetella bronchialis]ANN71438.1 hypothetical protein BAU08_08930 [Bordetella bronchialis]
MPPSSRESDLPQPLGDHLVLPLTDGAVLVFGLTWSPLIGTRVDVLARRKARETRATHYVHGGTGAAAVGCARLRGRAKACYAAAQVFAGMQGAGTAAGLLPLDDGRVWLVASRNGAVMARGDRVHPDAASARQALAELDAMHPGLAGQVRDLSLDGLAAALDPSACLWRAGVPLMRLPLPVQGAALLVVLAVLAPPAWRAWQRLGTPPVAASPDPARAWHEALAKATAAVRIHDASQLGRVFATLRALPTALQGWSMRSARCRPHGGDWACDARYARTAPDATNRALAEHLPAAIRPAFVTLDEATLSWRVTGAAGTLRPEGLPDPARTDIEFASMLQSIRPAFARVALGAPAALPVAAPRDAHGNPLPAPPDMPRLRKRPLVVHGPLRSFALFTQSRTVASWTAVSLTLHGERGPDIAHSPLMAQLEGTVYERE